MPELTEYVTTLIRVTAKAMIGKDGYLPQDLDELKQDLTLRYLSRKDFDPTKSTLNTFAGMVIRSAKREILQHRKAQKRDYRREVCSLQDPIGEDGDELIDLISDADDYRKPIPARG
jgi:hypothetical protein